MDWDDIKFLLALARKGSARGAAQVLGVSNSTVTRRLDDLEHTLQTHLFDRSPDGYRIMIASEIDAGFGSDRARTSAANCAMKSTGSKATWVVPSR